LGGKQRCMSPQLEIQSLLREAFSFLDLQLS